MTFCRTLCHSYNVARTTIEIPHNTPLPSQLDIPVLQDAHMPTHVLAILSTPRPSESSQSPAYLFPIIAPINAELFAQTFNKDVTHLSSHLAAPGSTMPIPSWDEATQRMVVTVPVIPLSVPHPYSMPLLLFFGLGLHRQYEPPPSPPRVSVASSSSSSTRSGSPNRRRSSNAGFPPGISTNLLSTYLLPIPVIEEFPAAAAMSRKMEEVCTEEELHTRVEFNRGLWRNILSLAPKDVEIIDIAHMAWNITADARRLRDRLKDLGLR